MIDISECRNLLLGVTCSANILSLPAYLVFFTRHFESIKIITTKESNVLITKNALRLFASDVFSHKIKKSAKLNHIAIAKWADIFMILPASANIISKIANGIADDLLTTTALAYGKEIIICPNMNHIMWNNPIMQSNINKLKNFGFNFIGPSFIDSFKVATKTIEKNMVVPPLEEFKTFFKFKKVND